MRHCARPGGSLCSHNRGVLTFLVKTFVSDVTGKTKEQGLSSFHCVGEKPDHQNPVGRRRSECLAMGLATGGMDIT